MSSDLSNTAPVGIEAAGGWPGLIGALLERRHLTAPEAAAAMRTILAGEATPAQLIGFVIALRAKGESAAELAGLLDAVLEHVEPVPLDDDQREQMIDIVGTGGDHSHSINVSTMAAIVAAGAGAKVCKHGARSASSRCGTADVLEQLGVQIELDGPAVVRCIERAGIGFCFAPAFHPAFRFAGPARREVGVPTVFNLLGPMANPGRVRRQVIGVANEAFASRMVETLRSNGSTHSWVVHGGGLDELTTTGPSVVTELRDGGIRRFEVDPADLGVARARHDDLVGGDPTHNAAVVEQVLAGAVGPHRDIVVLNAGAGLVVAGLVADLGEGIELAASAIDDGRAATALERLVAVSNAPVEDPSGPAGSPDEPG